MSNTTTKLTKEKLPAPKGIKILTGPEDEHAVQQSEIDREDAVRAKSFKWHEKPLAPFAIDREADWLAMRAALNRPELRVVFANPLAFLADAIAIIWFCSVDPEAWMNLTSQETSIEIRKWAAANVSAGEQNDAIQLAFDIFNRAHSTQASLKPEVGTSGK